MANRLIRFFSLSVEALVLGAMTMLLLLSPLTCSVLSWRVRYLRHFGSTFAKSARYIKALKRSRVISRNLQRKLDAPADAPEAIQGHCTHCGQCCVDRSCVFLEWNGDGNSQCAIYGNWYWRMTSCGSYPIDRESIAVYSCPSFKAIRIAVVAADRSIKT